jgi:DnaK suppressor protein
VTTLATPTSSPTPATDWAPFRELLETQRADCVRRRDLAVAEMATSVPDPVAVNRAATLVRTIEEIDAALERITAGTYGVCVSCRTAIPVERLEFRPHAEACVSCQRAR